MEWCDAASIGARAFVIASSIQWEWRFANHERRWPQECIDTAIISGLALALGRIRFVSTRTHSNAYLNLVLF
jgi:hypothetical protein